jgi:succinate-semialdehyde dehydrogenase/glutarate-semialdehyde dehydrogenase
MRYPEVKLYVDGEWRGATGRDMLPVTNPSTGQRLGALPVATDVDLDDALGAAQRAFASWRRVAAVERAALLHKAAGILRSRAEYLGEVLATELGNPIGPARFEAVVASDVFDWSAGETRRVYGRVIPSRFPGARQLALKEPIGPVFAVCPWNMPLIFPARKIAEALAAGCTVVIKPAEQTPGCAFEIVRALQEAGIPEGVVNLVFGVPDQISRRMLGSGAIRKLSFTGSVPVGKQLAKLAAEHLVKCTHELGGHAPTIVFDDANIETVAPMLAERKARVSGQACNAPTRFYVQEGVYTRFREAFAESLNAIRIGDPFAPTTQMGPVASEKRRAAIESLIADARSRGARAVTGGGRVGTTGFFHSLTLLDEVPDEARVMNEEPFGPIGAIQPFKTIDEVIEKANRLPYGLAAYGFSGSKRNLDALADRLEVGLLGLNHCNLAAAETPFGGVKESGYGSEGGSEGVEGYLITKFVTEIPS